MVAIALHTPSGARRCSERPLTIARAPPPPVGCEGSDRLIAELLVEGLAGEDEQAVAPGGHKHHWSRHDGILSATKCDDGSQITPHKSRSGFLKCRHFARKRLRRSR